MKKATIICIILLILGGCGMNQVKVYEGGPGTIDKPREPAWTIDNPPAKGEVTFERTKGEGAEKETVKIAVKNEGGNLNPFAWIKDVFTKVVGFFISKADVQIPI
ncbi:hypothetical protein LCGC14_0384330 [marine sediment metagenome]|uniref:Uncharacterized protein n=1 Tax=marine sediment metagenome TaxID=412755 RepID=A0A0F9T760_9ZZZZ